MGATASGWAVLGNLVLLSATVAAAYTCPASCDTDAACKCASTDPPGGLRAADTPQFIVLTNDGAVTSLSYTAIRNITDRHMNPNGCVMPATWFVMAQDTQPDLVRQLYSAGHEIATQTLTGPGMPDATEIVGCRTWLNQTCNVPLAKIKGFRAPYLTHDSAQRVVLEANGFLWDSSLTETWPSRSSPSKEQRIWPFTMDWGIPIDCSQGSGTCSETEVHHGLWEFPILNLQDADGAVIASMDPLGDNFAQYQREFERSYYGNRAPLGIHLQAGMLLAFSEHQDQLNRFLDMALAHENVWLITIREVLRWIKDPVSAPQYQLNCSRPTDIILPGGQACLPRPGGCGQGDWDSSQCACMCYYQSDSRFPGFCLDVTTGLCTVTKLYDSTVNKYSCPSSGPGASAPSLSLDPSATGSSSRFGEKVFAPFVDVTASPTPMLQTIVDATGQKIFSLGFIAARGVKAAWGGLHVMADKYLLDQVQSLQSQGGDFIVSFGGADATELAQVITDVTALAAEYQEVVDTYKLSWVDFDIEGAALGDSSSVDRRNKAIKVLQDSNPDLTVSYCLPVLPSGLSADGMALLSNAAANGVRVDVVQVMAMDFGDAAAPNPAGRMGFLAIQAALATRRQIVALGLTSTKIGIIPMIGVNDVASEVFTLEDACAVADFAATTAWVRNTGFWSVGRDKYDNTIAVSPTSSGIPQDDWAFTRLFHSLRCKATSNVTFSFFIKGVPAAMLQSSDDVVCQAVASPAAATMATCTIVAIVDATGYNGTAPRTYIRLGLTTSNPTVTRQALDTAALDGTLAASLASLGLMLDSQALTTLSELPLLIHSPAPSPAPSPILRTNSISAQSVGSSSSSSSVAATSSTSAKALWLTSLSGNSGDTATSGRRSGSSHLVKGALIGGVLGGVVALAVLAGLAVYLRRQKRGAGKFEGPEDEVLVYPKASTPRSQQPPSPLASAPIVKAVDYLRQVGDTFTVGSPRNPGNATPRPAAARQNSADPSRFL